VDLISDLNILKDLILNDEKQYYYSKQCFI